MDKIVDNVDKTNEKLQSLIGIPFGNLPIPVQADCVSLMVLAQRELFNKEIDLSEVDTDWTDETLIEMSQMINMIIRDFFIEIREEEITAGDVITADTLGYTHILTVVNNEKLLLHTGLRSSSRLIQFRKLRNARFWRLKE